MTSGSSAAHEDRRLSIAIGCDHNGLILKTALRDYMRGLGLTVTDFGVTVDDPVDYPDVGIAVAEAIAAAEHDRAVLVCGTGAGMAIVANKVPGVRAVCVFDPYTAERARASNNAQVITFGAEIVAPTLAIRLLDIWLASEFQGGRSAPKVAKIDALERRYAQRV